MRQFADVSVRRPFWPPKHQSFPGDAPKTASMRPDHDGTPLAARRSHVVPSAVRQTSDW